jgi:hypothetical protein
MRRKLNGVVTKGLCVLLIISLVGCEVGWDQHMNPVVADGELLPAVARVIDEQWAVVAPYLEETLLSRASDSEGSFGNVPDGARLVELILEEESGHDYLQFCYTVAKSDDSAFVLAAAKELLPKDTYEELWLKVDETERSMRSLGLQESRTLPPNQRAAFMRDLQKLVTKTIVLLVAGIVYACIPNVVFWGKVSAAAAIAVASGIVATTVFSIYRFYTYSEDEMAVSFQEWITDVTTDPAASFAIASSMLAVGKTMANGPVVTGLVIAVFSIYQVMDLLKPMLKKYNFGA